jgi:hypothetical protein
MKNEDVEKADNLRAKEETMDLDKEPNDQSKGGSIGRNYMGWARLIQVTQTPMGLIVLTILIIDVTVGVTAAAAKVGIDESTLRRWLQLDAFKRAFRAARRDRPASRAAQEVSEESDGGILPAICVFAAASKCES